MEDTDAICTVCDTDTLDPYRADHDNTVCVDCIEALREADPWQWAEDYGCAHLD